MNRLLELLPPPPAGRTGWPWTEETDPGVYRGAPASGAWPALTIVCPSFRQGRFIEETIRSVLLQNYPRLEFLILDGGSDDDTPSILQRYATWLAHRASAPDRGQADALNQGFARATGELFGWINSDDYFLPGAFAAAARAYRPGRRALYHGDWMDLSDENGRLTLHRERPCFAFQVACGGRTLPSHATFWPAAIHEPFDESLRFTLDAEFFKRLAAHGARPRHVPLPLGVFRRHPEAKSSTLVDVARAETQAWSRAQRRSTRWLWRLSLAVDRVRGILT